VTNLITATAGRRCLVMDVAVDASALIPAFSPKEKEKRSPVI
jgi:hypothetical protein